MTLWSSFFGLSFAGLAVIGPWLAEWQGVRALFLAHAGYMLAIAAVLALLLPRLAPAALTPLTRSMFAMHPLRSKCGLASWKMSHVPKVKISAYVFLLANGRPPFLRPT
jgi:hypothetical protein